MSRDGFEKKDLFKFPLFIVFFIVFSPITVVLALWDFYIKIDRST